MKAMQVLVYLIRHPCRVVSRSELEASVWPGRIVTTDAVTNAVMKVRRAFGDDARHPRIIETIPKSGYRLVADVVALNEVLGLDEDPLVGDGPRRGVRLAVAAGLSVVLLALLASWVLLTREDRSPDHAGIAPGKPAVAVLPFANLGTRPDQDYFADGITADLITDLSTVSGLLVIAPGTVFAYKGSDAGPREISAELAVDFVVVGSVQRSGDQLRVNVQLVGADGERALWGERYEGALRDVFAIQDRLVAAVIAALKVEVAPGERETLARRPTASVAAYDLYLRGLEAHGHRTREQNLVARDYFLQAIELDPAFARAYSGLALTHSRDAIDGWGPAPLRSLERAAELVSAAAGMDPSLPQVHFVTGQVDLFRRQHIKAIEATERAIRGDPNYADAYALRAWILNYAGHTDEALTAMGMAMRLSPRPTASYLEVLGEIRFLRGEYGASATVFERVLNINPNYMRARMWLAAAFAYASAIDRAEWEATELMVLNPHFSLEQLGFAFPFKDPRVAETLLAGLRKAGLPDRSP